MRIIAHLDMDAFFAAVEERDKPFLRGKPIVVGADPKDGGGRGVVSTANYRAREYGIHSGLPISVAWRFSEAAEKAGKPPVFFVSVDFTNYDSVSGRIFEILRKYAAHIEPASIDEAYLDLSFAGSYAKAKDIVLRIKNEIKEKERLTASVGIGPNKLIAKIASDFQKPDGLTIIKEKDKEKFLEPLSIRKIPGIGPKTEILFNQRGAKKVSDLKKFSVQDLHNLLGKWGDELYDKIRGKNSSPIGERYKAKSVGEQETFEKDTLESALILQRMKMICENIIKRLKAESFKSFRTIAVTVRFADFETKTRSRTLKTPASTAEALYPETIKLLLPFFDKRENPKHKLIRLIGARVEKLA